MELNSIEVAISRAHPPFGALARTVRKQTVDLVVQYLFRVINYKKLKNEANKLVKGLKTSKLLEVVTHNGYILKHIKLWLFHCAKRGKGTNSVSLRREFHIKEVDRNLGSMLGPKTWAYLAKLGRKYKGMSLTELEKVTSNIAIETSVYIRKFLNKKLLFIMRSQKIKLQDLENEVLYKGLRGLYLMLPRVESNLHATNIVKRTLKQRGLNLIQHYTTQKRATLIQNEDKTGFHSNTISLSAYTSGENENVLSTLGLESGKSDLSFDVQRFCSTITSTKKKRFVNILMGGQDIDFDAYLKKERLITKYDELPVHKFLEVCFDFLDVSTTKGWKFVQDMQQYFVGYKSQSNSNKAFG